MSALCGHRKRKHACLKCWKNKKFTCYSIFRKVWKSLVPHHLLTQKGITNYCPLYINFIHAGVRLSSQRWETTMYTLKLRQVETLLSALPCWKTSGLCVTGERHSVLAGSCWLATVITFYSTILYHFMPCTCIYSDRTPPPFPRNQYAYYHPGALG